MNAALLTTYSLWKREIVRFLRQRSRVAGALLQPLLFWLLFGFGFGASFKPGMAGVEGAGAPGAQEMSYLEYYFPGTIALIVMFTAIFSSFSVIEDRNEGFLQSVLVAPVPGLSIVLGKVCGGATLATMQGAVFALLAPLAGVPLDVKSFLAVVVTMYLVALGLSGIGFCLAWRTDSTSGFHAIMSLLLMPMWLLSGAFFPVAGAPFLLEWAMRVNPLTYGVAALRYALYGTTNLGLDIPSFKLSFGLTLGFAVFMMLLAPRSFRSKKYLKR